MIRRFIPLALGLVLAAGLATPATAQPARPTAAQVVAAEARTVQAKYPGIHFATPADAVRLGPALDALNPNGVPPPDPSKEYTVAQYKASLIGRRIGPSANTYNGEFYITGWTASGNKWLRTRSEVTCPICETVGSDQVDPNIGIPNWANPTKWNWHSILGAAMDAIWNSCTKGALTGIVSTAGATMAANLAARAAPVYLGPYGYAAFAISSCVIGIINQ